MEQLAECAKRPCPGNPSELVCQGDCTAKRPLIIGAPGFKIARCGRLPPMQKSFTCCTSSTETPIRSALYQMGGACGRVLLLLPLLPLPLPLHGYLGKAGGPTVVMEALVCCWFVIFLARVANFSDMSVSS